jgi:hypothetical protein
LACQRHADAVAGKIRGTSMRAPSPIASLRRLLAAVLTIAAGIALTACGQTIQFRPVPADQLVKAITSVRFPVYWLGRNFEGLPITTIDRDPGGAYDAAYGNCLHGGQGTCITPVLVVTSPDNSFVPGPRGLRPHTTVRGRRAVTTQNGRTLQIPTGPVIVSIYASSPALARQVAEALSPVNEPGSPGAPLPPPLPNTGYGQTPLGSRDLPPSLSGAPRRPGAATARTAGAPAAGAAGAPAGPAGHASPGRAGAGGSAGAPGGVGNAIGNGR